MRTLLALAMLGAQVAFAQTPCQVFDPELQAAYAGGCKDGLAEGFGEAQGTAEYRGEFKAGKKHGKGVKIWPSGDRYEGDFVEDRKEGVGTYVWGARTQWAGERYEGEYRNDMRHGFGIYRWPSGDVYAGPWHNDLPTGPATPMMLARATFQREAQAALSRPGTRACREMRIGLTEREWIHGTVMQAGDGKVAIRIEHTGTHLHVVAGVEVIKGDTVWDDATLWVPCY